MIVQIVPFATDQSNEIMVIYSLSTKDCMGANG